MKTLIFMASPNKIGNTQAMLEAFLKDLQGEISIINPYQVHVKPCIDCKYCYTNVGQCSIKDDMITIYEQINESDNIVVFSPMYFASYPGTFKNIIDRTQVFWSKKYILKIQGNKKNKKGLLFLNAGSEWGGMFKHMENMFKYFMKTLDGELVESMYVSNTDNNPISTEHEVVKKLHKIAKKI